MMRVNQFNSSAFTQNTQNRSTRTSNTPSFAGVMSNISGQQQTPQVMPQQSNTMQMPGMGRMSVISGMQSNFPAMMPGGNMPSGMPEMPSGDVPTGQMPEMPSGDMPYGQMPPAMLDGTQPVDGQELPALPDDEELPERESLHEMPAGQTPPEIPNGEMPVSAPSESDSNIPQPPFEQPSFGGMNRPGSFSGMDSMNSFRAMNFMNR